MIRIAPLALATLLAATVPLRAQTPQFTDPANLRGERISPRTGRELPIDQGALGLEELLRKLNTRASILNIVAHPDDEDGGMLTLYARGYGARVADLSLTRGEGGQNAMTADFEDALGLLRTEELLSNDRYTGVTQMFGTEVDFGFSKTKSESFAKWTHDRVLYDAVRAIRLYRPLVITATFIGNPTDGHGQHQVSGQIAQEAFVAAGDPNIFPELTREGILPWQPLKMYARAPMQAISAQGLFDYATGQYVPAQFTNYVTGVTSATPPTPDITIHEGTTDPLITTCAANPSDLPASLRSASNSSNLSVDAVSNASNLSSRPQPATNLSSRPEARSAGVERPAVRPASNATACRPLSYVQFARIGLGLQRTQIGPGVRNASSGRFDVPYHLYGTCVNPSSTSAKLCHLDRSLAASSQGAAERPLYSARSAITLSSRPERSAVERPASPSVAALPPDPSNHEPPQAPTARNIPAQGNALGVQPNNEQRAEGPLYNPALTIQSVQTLSSRPEARSAAAERPASPPTPASPFQPSSLASQPNFFDGIDTSIEGIASLAPHASPALVARLHKISQDIVEAQRLYDPRNLIASAPSLVHARQELFELQNEILLGPPLKSKRHADDELNLRAWSKEDCANVWHELRVKDVQVNDALALALGVHLDATAPTDNGDITAGSALQVHVALSVDSKVPLGLFPILVRNDRRKIINAEFPLERPGYLRIVENFAFPFPASGIKERTITTHPEGTVDITRPYFTRQNIEQPFYDLLQPELRNAPASPPALVVSTGVDYMDQEISIARIVHSGPQPISIVPRTSLSVSPTVSLLFGGQHSSLLRTTVRSAGLTSSPATVSIQKPEDWTVTPRSASLSLAAGDYDIRFTARAPETLHDLRVLEAIVQTPAGSYTEGFRPVGYGDLPRTNFYTLATDRIVPVDLKLPPADKRRIAYLPGTGDDVPAALASIGLKPTILTVADLTPEKLKAFDTVILGVRTYNAHPDLHGAPTEALLDFARSGGNVLVQYQTREFTAADAPFPLSLGSDEKVVDETDPVEILHADSTRFTTPNHINTTDFDHWIEERGHGFLGSWDPHYTALTETHDPGQLPQKGGLITVQVGRGHWTYCAFALYRQLPEAVPGAFRLFVNLLNP